MLCFPMNLYQVNRLKSEIFCKRVKTSSSYLAENRVRTLYEDQSVQYAEGSERMLSWKSYEVDNY